MVLQTQPIYCVLLQATCFDLSTGHHQALFEKIVYNCYACSNPIMFTSIKHVK